jgi:hypothetical protein
MIILLDLTLPHMDHTISQIQGWPGIPSSSVLAATDSQAAQFLGTNANNDYGFRLVETV